MTTLRARLAVTPAGFEVTRGRVLAIYAGIGVALLLASLDQTIVATVLPRIVSDIGGVSQYAWVFTAFMLTSTVTIPLYGKLSDAHGRRSLFVVAISVLLVSSLLCGLAQNMLELILARGLQGVGAGALFPLALATVAEIVPPRERGRYQGLLGMGFVAGSIIGPLAGGFIADNTSWRWAFFLNLPLGVLALAIIIAALPGQRVRRERSIDWLGACVLAAATTGLLLALTWGGTRYAWLSAPVVLTLVASVGLGGTAFLVIERRVREPILPFGLLRQRTVAASVAASGLAAAALFGVMSYVPLFVQGVIGASATSSGIVLMPLLVGDVVASIVTGHWIARTGLLRPNAFAGAVLLTIGTTLLCLLTIDSGPGQALVATLVIGVGLGCMMQVFTISIQNAVAVALIGAATALGQFSRALGSMIGVTLMGVIVNQRLPAQARAGLADSADLHAVAPALRVSLEQALQSAFVACACIAALVLAVVATGIENVTLRRTVQA